MLSEKDAEELKVELKTVHTTKPDKWLEKLASDPLATVARIAYEYFRGIQVTVQCNDIEEFLKNKTTGRNRSNHIPCLDKTRVKLKAVGEENDYIHANWVKLSDDRCRFILTQAPLAETAADFWSVVWEERVFLIVCLTHLNEQVNRKLFQYWPTNCGKQNQKSFGSICVSKISDNEPNGKVTKLELENEKTKEIREIKHYYYHDWPAHHAPLCTDNILRLLAFMDNEAEGYRNNHDSATVLVHSCTGTGRAGTLVALYELVSMVNMNMTPSVSDAVVKVRKQRAMALDGDDQYMFLYWATMLYALGKSNNSMEFKREVARRLKVMRSCSTQSTCIHYERMGRASLDKTQEKLKSKETAGEKEKAD